MSITASNNPFPHDPDYNWDSKLDSGGYTGTGQDLFDMIDIINAPDQILVKGKVTKTLNTLSIEAGSFTCRIDQQTVTNAGAYSTSIDEAADGHHRIDILVFTKFGTIIKIKGAEDIESAQEPDTPEHTIKIAFVTIFGNTIANPELPIESGFITKASKSLIKMASAGDVDFYPVDDRSFLSFESGMLSLKSIKIENSNDTYLGKTYIIKNASAVNVTLYHNIGTGNFKFWLPNNSDLILKANESICLVLRIENYGTYTGYLECIGKVVASTDDITEGNNNKYSTLARVMGYFLTGISFLSGDSISAVDTILSAFGKLQKQITNLSSTKQDISNQLDVTLPATVDNSWHGKTIFFTNSGTLTIPASLTDAFLFNGITITGVTITWAITSPHVWYFGTPSSTPEKQIFTLTKKGTTNNILLLGI